MATILIDKVVASVPAVLAPNTIYAVRVGTGFSLFVSDMTGTTAHTLNQTCWQTEDF